VRPHTQRQWFAGVVAAFNATHGQHMVHYDDGQKRLENFNELNVQWLQSSDSDSVGGEAVYNATQMSLTRSKNGGNVTGHAWKETGLVRMRNKPFASGGQV